MEPDPAGFFQHLRDNGKPALAALAGSAFRLSRDADTATFFFDKTRGNVMPMLRSPQNLEALREAVGRYFGKSLELHFAIGVDPNLVEARRRDAQALEDVQSNRAVQFLRERFNADIVNCEPLDKPKGKTER